MAGRIFDRYIQTIKIFSQTESSVSGDFEPDLTGLSLGSTVSNMVLNSKSGGIIQIQQIYGEQHFYIFQNGISGPDSPFT